LVEGDYQVLQHPNWSYSRDEKLDLRINGQMNHDIPKVEIGGLAVGIALGNDFTNINGT
jgi:hypothetical protein